MAEEIGALYATKIPALADAADIQEAFRVYHYGAPSGSGEDQYAPSNSNPSNLVPNSIAGFLQTLRDDIDNFVTGVVPSAWTRKGAMLVATDVSTPTPFSPPFTIENPTLGTGFVLTVNPATATGLEWQAPAVTLTNEVTLANKNINLSTVLFPGLKFAGSDTGNAFRVTLVGPNPTADRTITFPDATGTVITTGNLEDLDSLSATLPFALSTAGNVEVFKINDNPNGTIEIGRIDGIASTPYIDFHSGTDLVDYDVRIAASGGTGAIGQGTLRILGNLINNVNTVLKTGAHTLAAADYNTVVQMNAAAAFTVSTGLSTAPVGTQITLIARTTGVSVAAGTGVTIIATPGLKLRTTGSLATLLCLGTNTWILSGDLIA